MTQPLGTKKNHPTSRDKKKSPYTALKKGFKDTTIEIKSKSRYPAMVQTYCVVLLQGATKCYTEKNGLNSSAVTVHCRYYKTKKSKYKFFLPQVIGYGHQSLCALCTVHCALCTIHCTVHSVRKCKVHNAVHGTVHSSVQCRVQCIAVQCMVQCSAQCKAVQCSEHCSAVVTFPSCFIG